VISLQRKDAPQPAICAGDWVLREQSCLEMMTSMVLRLKTRGLQSALVFIMVSFCSCKSANFQRENAQTQSSPMAASVSTGIVVAVRSVDITAGSGDQTGFDDVLGALQQTPPATEIDSKEVVIRRPDGTATSAVNPGPDYLTGDSVTIFVNSDGAVIRRD
jgi:hypothetical protein